MCTTLQGTWGDIGVLCVQPYMGHRGDIGVLCAQPYRGQGADIGVLCAQPYRGHRRGHRGIMYTTLQGT